MRQPYVKLSDHLPLDTPFTLMIDPTNLCNFKCTFCPTGDPKLLKSVNRPRGIMEFDVYTKIIDDLTAFPRKIRSLRLFKDGEPFVNKNLVKMIAYAKEKDVADEVYIITNASLIDVDVANAILDAGLDVLRVSVEHVTPAKYKEVTKTYSDYQRIIQNVRYLFEEKTRRNHSMVINSKIVDIGLSPDELEIFRSDFGPISDSLTVETLMGWSKSLEKDFTLESAPAFGIDGKSRLSNIEVCPEPFKGMAINFDGTVSICCVDWSHGTLVGDAKKQSVVEIWNGPEMQAFRMRHLNRERDKIPACANCQYLKGHNPLAHLDDVADSLMTKYARTGTAAF